MTTSFCRRTSSLEDFSCALYLSISRPLEASVSLKRSASTGPSSSRKVGMTDPGHLFVMLLLCFKDTHMELLHRWFWNFWTSCCEWENHVASPTAWSLNHKQKKRSGANGQWFLYKRFPMGTEKHARQPSGHQTVSYCLLSSFSCIFIINSSRKTAKLSECAKFENGGCGQRLLDIMRLGYMSWE